MNLRWVGTCLFAAAIVGASCGVRDDTIQNPAAPTEVASVVPFGGAVAVDIGSTIRISFTRAMMPGMEAYAMLHEGSVDGPETAGTWSFSADGTVLSFVPDSPLKPQTLYTIHLGGGLRDASGDMISYARCTESMGGQWVTRISGGMGSMMGVGWQNSNGRYGMTFSFTTA
jgi:hypothetical protein